MALLTKEQLDQITAAVLGRTNIRPRSITEDKLAVGAASAAVVRDGSISDVHIGTLTLDALSVEGAMQSSNYVAGTDGWRFTPTTAELNTGVTIRGALDGATGTFSGDLNAAGGTFTGALSAATGTFAGSLSAATGTFAGSLSAASGTFTGTLSGGVISGGTIDIGGADATSFHVDANGNMWLGAATYAAAPFRVSNAGIVAALEIGLELGGVYFEASSIEYGSIIQGAAGGLAISAYEFQLYVRSTTGGTFSTFNALAMGWGGPIEMYYPLVVQAASDVSLSANTGVLRLGDPTGTHMVLDDNEIQAKASGTTAADLYLQELGGDLYIGNYHSGQEIFLRGEVRIDIGAGAKLNFGNNDYIGYVDASNYFTFDADGGSGNADLAFGADVSDVRIKRPLLDEAPDVEAIVDAVAPLWFTFEDWQARPEGRQWGGFAQALHAVMPELTRGEPDATVMLKVDNERRLERLRAFGYDCELGDEVEVVDPMRLNELAMVWVLWEHARRTSQKLRELERRLAP